MWPDCGNTYGLLTFTNGQNDVKATLNLAYDKWVDRVQQASGLAETIATWRESARLIENSTRGLVTRTKRFVKNVKSDWKTAKRYAKKNGNDVADQFLVESFGSFYGNMKKFWEQLGYQRSILTAALKAGLRYPLTLLQKMANLWLAYSFGVKPTVESIYDSMEAMTDEPPVETVTARTMRSFTINRKGYLSRLVSRCSVGARISGRVKVTNPNLALASQLGFTNPILLGFQIIPFSFVLDWYTGMERFLSSFTDLLGLEVSDPYYAYICRGLDDSTKWFNVQETSWANNQCTFVVTQRLLGLYRPLPTWPSSAQLGRSMTRVLNAVALLVTILSRGRIPRFD